MPGFDRTGPMDAGPMTGGARGRCNPDRRGYDPRFYPGSHGGLGLRRGFRGGSGGNMDMGRGRAFGRGYGWYPPTVDPGMPLDTAGEADMLRAQADYLRTTLDAITERIGALENKSADTT